jgi:prepilin-type N-terminal cleavage/methylation domain-containing protein
MAHNRSNPGGPRRAFTLTEMLVVVAILAILISTLFVAVNVASRRTQNVKTQFLMGTISSGLVQFNTDHGYYPPVLGRAPNAPTNPVQSLYRDVRRINDLPGSNIVAKQQEWYSYTTLAEYLLGFGTRDQDGYGALRRAPAGSAPEVGDREFPALGIRSPGRDGCWGAIESPHPQFTASNFAGRFVARNPSFQPKYPSGNQQVDVPQPGNAAWNRVTTIEGRVYGPYIDSLDDNLVGGISGIDSATGKPIIVTADTYQPATGAPTFDQLPKTILDYWGEPITYTRTPYIDNDLRSNAPTLPNSATPMSLGDVFVLRPWEVDERQRSAGVLDGNNDDTSTAQLRGASFALVSAGRDRKIDRSVRRDLNEFNKDNIIEVSK